MVTIHGIIRENTGKMGTFGVLTSKDLAQFIGKPIIAEFKIDQKEISKKGT